MNESWLPPDPTGNRLGHVLDDEYDNFLSLDQAMFAHYCHRCAADEDQYIPPFDYMNDNPFEGSRESDEYPNE